MKPVILVLALLLSGACGDDGSPLLDASQDGSPQDAGLNPRDASPDAPPEDGAVDAQTSCMPGDWEVRMPVRNERLGAAFDGEQIAMAYVGEGSQMQLAFEVSGLHGEARIAPIAVVSSTTTAMARLETYGIDLSVAEHGYALAWVQQLELDDDVFGAAGEYEFSEAVVIDRMGNRRVGFSRYGRPDDAYGSRVHSRYPQVVWIGDRVQFAWQDLRSRMRAIGQVRQDSGIYGVLLDTSAGSAGREQLLAERASGRNPFYLASRRNELLSAIVTIPSRGMEQVAVGSLPSPDGPAITNINVRPTDLVVGPDGTPYVTFVQGLRADALFQVGTVGRSAIELFTVGRPSDPSTVKGQVVFLGDQPLVVWTDGAEVGWQFVNDTEFGATRMLGAEEPLHLLDADVDGQTLRILVHRTQDLGSSVHLIQYCLDEAA